MTRYTATLTPEGTATVPAEVRNVLGLEPGQAFDFVVDDSGEVRVTTKRRKLSDLKGLFGTPDKPVDVDEAIAATIALRTAPGRVDPDP